MKKSRENPDKYVFHANNDTVHWGTLDGKNYVLDCPCNSALRYEALFWNSRGVIASYFSKRAKRQLNAAQEDSRLADSVSTNIEKSR